MKRLPIITLALLAAACGGVSPNGPRQSNDPAAAAFRYAACMHKHGVPEVPDPQVSTSGGQTSIRQIMPASAASSPRFKSAQKICGDIIKAANTGPDQAQIQAKKKMLLAFASCLRGHGISGFPDPDAQGRLTMDMLSAAGIDLHAPSFFKAARACVGVTHGAITMAQVEQAVNGHH